ncbi:aldehyde dehydrogenase (NAD+) [Pseudarcicella hirudinis]|uniref:Aldehyde dehydrogenase n=1 Tax=Pseudarcicella hirudinis TaxID=1079859 RepID=A0A1I5UUQ4_9BACT|nr:aldehyde dehydrogenase family protein [Pseudarcicella hirudinis]SFP98985.1 aldehyde dehydrogenase (NAD+) [Pseudarcicella hirudinis]
MEETIVPKDLEQKIQHLFQLQKSNASNIARTPANERIQKLRKLLDYNSKNIEKIQEAIFLDFKKHPSEVIIGELMGVNGEIKHLIKNLRTWMRPHKVPTPLNMFGTSAYVKFEPKGQCLIISPWNYPFNLAIKPLAQAIAAGNTVILKPSELTPNTSALIKEMLSGLFPEDEIAVIEGDARVSTELLNLPFNHIFFTGSPQVGKIVMKAASRHLASVTLELGGKSPFIVDETADIKTAGEKLAWGKFINAGQTCIAPDYVLVHKNVKSKLISATVEATEKMFNPEAGGLEKTTDFSRIVNQRHFLRLKSLIEDALENGASLVYGGETNAGDNYISPTILTGTEKAGRIMQEEIFGPVLPIIEFEQNAEVIEKINAGEKPLALYIHSRKRSNIDYFINNTSSGGVVINDVLIHYAHKELPFGGVNNSGIGKSGGIWGFTEFSNQKAVLKQRLNLFKMIYPPYTPRVKKLLGFLLKYV